MLLLQFFCSSLPARPVATHQAKKLVAGWLMTDARPFRTPIARRVLNVQTFNDDDGNPAYYIVYLKPSGFVIVSADDSIEPIIGFADDGFFDPSLENPLGALVTNDLKSRITAARSPQKPQFNANAHKHRSKWVRFTALAETSNGNAGFMAITSVSDIRVAPLLQSTWNQYTACGDLCYNYYTPANYYTGCVATAMAQLMRYHQHPSTAIGIRSFSIQKDGGTPYLAYTLGGDEAGGPYDFSKMPLSPNCSTTDTQRKAIGALCYDAGISINTNYGSSYTEADTLKAKNALTSTFKYGNAIKGYNNLNNIGPGLTAMINPNLDAKDPVIIGITGSNGGHAVVVDGYGYNSSTLYHHLNMGWSGYHNAWYNLPNIDSNPSFTTVYKCIYNIRISPSGNGEVISGRLLDQNGYPVAYAPIWAKHTGSSTTLEATSDAKGIYAFGLLNSNSSYTLNPSAEGYIFSPRTVATGRSRDNFPVSGNVWDIDFYGQILEISTITPASGPPGTYMKIQGQNFGAIPGEVIFPDGKLGEELQWSDTTIYCRAPLDAVSGDIKCRTAALNLSSPKYFNVTNPAAIIADIGNFTLNIENGTAQYPFGSIQKAIDAASPADTVIVKQGTYPETIRFRGYNITLSSSAPNVPGVVASTIIDGSLTGPVVTFENGEGPSCLLTGFTITNGASVNGGAIFCSNSSPTISYCTIANNSATGDGGAMYNIQQSSPTLVNCTFITNSAVNKGGCMYNSFSSPTLVNCIIIANFAGDDGGAIYSRDYSIPTITNCTLIANAALDTTGGICNNNTNPPVFVHNSILWANSDKSGLGESAQISGGLPDINYSCIQGWTGFFAGIGNIGSDPNFLRHPDDGQDGWGTGDNDDFGDLRLSSGSPCIDAGDNTSVSPDTADLDSDGDTTELTPYDIRGLSRFFDVASIVDTGNPGASGPPVVDMGAYEMPYLSCPEPSISDINRDCLVNLADYAAFAFAWLTTPQHPRWNQNCDIASPENDIIDMSDLAVFLKNFLPDN